MQLEQWQLELQQSIRTVDQLAKLLPLTDRQSLNAAVSKMRLAITPHTQKLIDWNDPRDPLLLMAVPSEDELTFIPEELVDPIGDEAKSPVPFLTHRYPDRVLICVTFLCSGYCRFCFRRTRTGHATPGPAEADIERIVDYLRAHSAVEEVILSGGDPLTLQDGQLDDWLTRLREVRTVRRIRIHTRVPVTLPSRVTDSLVNVLRRHQDATHPVYLVTHFNHPREIAAENIAAIAKLADAGLVVRNQHPLLRGINDDAVVLEELYRKLVDIRVAPYYLHHLDLAKGTGHFRVPLERGLALMKSLQGTLSGIAIPRYILDLPGGHGKVPLMSPFATRAGERSWSIESPLGDQVEYTEPTPNGK